MSPMINRAVVDFPQPDSPTIPTTSPLSTESETSSTARTTLLAPNQPVLNPKCLTRFCTCSSGCAGPPISLAGTRLSASDIHRTPQAVAQEVEADRNDEDHRAGQS